MTTMRTDESQLQSRPRLDPTAGGASRATCVASKVRPLMNAKGRAVSGCEGAAARLSQP